MKKIKTAIIGAAGYTGGELLRLLVHHPACELMYVHSNSQKGKKVTAVHPDLIGDTDLEFTDEVQTEGIEAVFLGLPHGQTKGFLENHPFPKNTVIIDLSTDFRDESHGFVYGLPEVNKTKIQEAKKNSQPGLLCYRHPTRISPCYCSKLGKRNSPYFRDHWQYRSRKGFE